MSTPRVLPARRSAAEAVLRALDQGALVVVPTDTVYGLAARLDRPAALQAVFEAKGRPSGLALPVLVGRNHQAKEVATEWPETAASLADRFWPGALTLVVPTSPEIGALLGGDGRTVGLRLPHQRFLARLCRSAGPLAVTSANRHGEPPCTSAEEAAATFSAEEVALVLDGGPCDGEPSTVVDCTGRSLRCLRPGAVPWAWVEAAAALDAGRRRSKGARRRWGLGGARW